MAKIIITGANRGIGLELCKQLSGRGDEVTAVCRRVTDELRKLDVRICDGIDVTDGEALAHLSRELRGQRFDWLINNAGILVRDTLESLRFHDIEKQFSVNAMGPLRVTAALLPNLGKGSRIGIITSRMGSVEDNTSGAYYGYRMAKAAVNMAGKSLSIDLAPQGILVAILHPGMVATDMTQGRGVSVSHAAQGLIQRMEELDEESSGSFWHAEGGILPW